MVFSFFSIEQNRRTKASGRMMRQSMGISHQWLNLALKTIFFRLKVRRTLLFFPFLFLRPRETGAEKGGVVGSEQRRITTNDGANCWVPLEFPVKEGSYRPPVPT
jgi:hypothetical protein